MCIGAIGTIGGGTTIGTGRTGAFDRSLSRSALSPRLRFRAEAAGGSGSATGSGAGGAGGAAGAASSSRDTNAARHAAVSCWRASSGSDDGFWIVRIGERFVERDPRLGHPLGLHREPFSHELDFTSDGELPHFIAPDHDPRAFIGRRRRGFGPATSSSGTGSAGT